MRIGNILKAVEEMMGDYLGNHRLWYNAKYDRSIILLPEGDADVWKLIKGNDEFAYMFVTEEDGPISKKVQVSEVVRGRNFFGGRFTCQCKGRLCWCS